MIIYTRGFRPFVMGGNVHYHFGAEVPTTDAVQLREDVSVCLAVSPLTGRTYAVLAETGAIVGSSLAEARSDFEEADPAILARQLAQSRKDRAAVEVIGADDFWARMAKARS